MSIKKGRFTEAEDDFIKSNHGTMTDRELADALGRNQKAISNRRARLGLNTSRSKPKLTADHREAYVASLDSTERGEFFKTEVVKSALFKSVKIALTPEEQDYYIEKYVGFMSDPTIETMTAMEKDALHQLLLAEIRVARHMREEKEYNDRIKEWRPTNPDSKPPAPISRAKEIRECQEVILKCQHSLNVERVQRLKNQSDQSITFTNLIKEMKDPGLRMRLGQEAGMLKFIAERFYNNRQEKNFFSGHGRKYDESKNFRQGQPPPEGQEFLPPVQKEE